MLPIITDTYPIGKKEQNACAILFLVDPILGALNIPGRFAIVSLLFIAYFFKLLKDTKFKEIAFSYPLLIWLILTIFHYTNGILKQVPEVDFVDFLHGFKIYACISIFTYWACRDLKGTLNILVKVFTVYLFICLFICDYDERGRFSGTIYATQLGQTAAVYGFYLAFALLMDVISKHKYIVLALFAICIILMTQSRNSLAMLSISFVGLYLSLHLKKGKNISYMIFFGSAVFLLMLFMSSYFIESTELGARFVSERNSLENSYTFNELSTGTFFDKIVGDRLFYYVVGWQCFLQSPITGIGIWNFMYYTDSSYVLHTEYMVHLCEGGLIALSLWVVYYVQLFKSSLKYSITTYQCVMTITGLFMLLFCALYSREFFYEFFYPVHGIVLSFMMNGKLEKKQ